MVQFLIAVLTIPALFLVAQRNPNKQRWGFLIGLIGQPFWLWSTFSSDAYGMFVVSVFCTWSWLVGVWNFWWIPLRSSREGRVPCHYN